MTQDPRDTGSAGTTACPFSTEGTRAFPPPRTCPFDPPADYKELRAHAPVAKVTLWNGQPAWLITRYDDFRRVLTDPRFSADTERPGFPGQSPGMNVARNRYRTFVSMDPPEHTRYRRMLTGEFSIKRMEQLRPKIQKMVDDLIDDMVRKGPPADLVEDFALAVPSRVICELLGVPYEDHEFFQQRANTITSNLSTTEEALQATRELCDEYIAALLERKNAAPQDDLLSRMVVENLRPGHLTPHQLVSMARQLLVAGHETTANMIALGTLLLLEHPNQLAALKTDPDLADSAIEEMLRYLDVTHLGRRRVALEDVEVDGQMIRAGEGIIAASSSANRDANAFPDPDRFDIHHDARHHMTFGYGVHQCLGQPLARVELQVVFRTLFARLPDLRLAAPLDTLKFKNDMLVYGVESAPITW